MPNDRSAKPRSRYKVEEVSSDHEAKEPKPVESTEEAPVKEETPVPSKITSFSMVDAPHVKEAHSNILEPAEKEAVPTPEPAEPEAVASVESNPETPPEVPETEPQSDVSSSEITEWLQSVRPDTTKEGGRTGGGKGKILAIFLVVLIFAALGGGVYYYRSNVSENGSEENNTAEVTKSPEITSAPTESPTPTTVAIDASKYKVRILNGSGTAGEAGKAQSYLEGVGFKSFKTGNASSFNYSATEVSMKAGTPDEVFIKVKAALENYYQEVVKAEKALDAKSEFDLEITIGKKKS